jgi:hypothetical protein
VILALIHRGAGGRHLPASGHVGLFILTAAIAAAAVLVVVGLAVAVVRRDRARYSGHFRG